MEPSSDDVLDQVSATFLSNFVVGELLGKGSYGHVYAARDRKTGQQLALKIIPRSKLGAKGEQSVRNEVEMMTALQHPKILRLHTTAFDTQAITLVLDQVRGGEVFKHLVKVRHYSERTVCQLMKNLMVALKYMHDEGIVHRDLKPENLLLVEEPRSEADATDIRIGDFGFAARYRGVPLTQACGTPYYMAPEILEVGLNNTRPHYGESVDVWSAGVICYVLLAGYPPFQGRDKTTLFRSICRGLVDFTKAPWSEVSYEAKDFVLRMLQVNPAKRLTAASALEHRWLKNVESTPDIHLVASQHELSSFMARTKIKGAVYGAEAAFRLRYLSGCQTRQAKANTQLLEMFTAATEPIRKIDLSDNYLGPQGLEALVIALVDKRSCVEVLILNNSLIDDTHAGHILDHLSEPESRVRHLELNDNPISHATGRRILGLLQRGGTLKTVSCRGAHISEGLQEKIQLQGEYNVSREALKESPTNIVSSGASANTKVVVATNTAAGAVPSDSTRPSTAARRTPGPNAKYDAADLPQLQRSGSPSSARPTTSEGLLPAAPKYNPAFR
jgi:serine/threonine protein kinase